MVTIGFTCAKNTLCSVNVIYMMVGFSLIGAASWGKGFGVVANIHIIGAVKAVGIFLLLISFIGLVGAIKHHQIILFFYTVILLFVFLFQFGISCSCLAFSRKQQDQLVGTYWGLMSNDTRRSLEQLLDCCGLFNSEHNRAMFRMDTKLCIAACKQTGHCFTCGDLMLQHASETLRFLGSVGLLFSFSEIVALWLAMHYRNLKNPQANPNPNPKPTPF
ncbi:tetraspanin-31-like isoform X2 [Brachyhypopomus gauderio]|uniref:tetraspanin-31-like isoform X2 n=1 Tax=Brachyhypopomus gauderio TaxID=698409 RepID=UPI004042DC5F